MRTLDLYWKSNKDWWYYDDSFIPRLKDSAPPDAQESYARYKEQKRSNPICDICPRMQKYYDVGLCPICGVDYLLMDIKTHIAVCDNCKAEFAIPLAIEGLCHDDIRFKRYEATICEPLPTDTMLEVAKILGINTVELCKSIHTRKEHTVSYDQAYRLKKLLSPSQFSLSPEIAEYPKYEICYPTTRTDIGNENK